MRLTSEMFVAALTRRLFADGGFAAVERRGASAAGAVFVTVRGRKGRVRLFGPAPQSLSETGAERRFIEETVADQGALTRRLDSEARFDPDFWLVDIETDEPGRYIEILSD